MVIKNIPQIGDPRLLLKAKVVKNIFDPRIRRIIRNLVDTMHYFGLVGMAAPQIGKSVRIFVSEIRETKRRKGYPYDPLRVYINPKILRTSKKQVVMEEGCGSVGYGEIFGPVKRPEKVLVEATDMDGHRFRLKAGGLLARVILHEMDHLDGELFLYKVTDIKKISYRKR